MKNVIFLFSIFLVLFLGACSSEKEPEKDNSGQLNEKCRENSACDDNLVCKSDICISQADACKRVTCSNHGTCIVESSKAVCDCDNGFQRKADNPWICEVSDVCNGITCSNRGVCEEKNGEASCNCEDGYKAIGENCIKETGRCADVSCGDYGKCQVNSETNLLECLCDEGYSPQGLNCISDDAPCQGITCSGHGTCNSSGAEVTCDCEEGFVASGLECIDEASNPCNNEDCSGHGECQIHSEKAVCICSEGYTPGEGLTCNKENTGACEGIDCSGHGVCQEDNDGNAICICDNGYTRANDMCIENLDNPCKEQTCSNHGLCKVDDNYEAFCECDGGYFPSESLTCVGEAEICSGVTCSNHGSCVPNDAGVAACVCEENYVAVGTSCVLNPCLPNPCFSVENVSPSNTCVATETSFYCECSSGFFWNSGASTCDINDTCDIAHSYPNASGDCVCDDGYQFTQNNEACELISGDLCNPNPCAGIENSECSVIESQVMCLCIEGFDFNDFGDCVREVCANNPCLNNGDENRNVCAHSGDTYECYCDDGYIDEAGVCTISTSACDANTCSETLNATGVCEPYGDEYACLCEDTFAWSWDNLDCSISCSDCPVGVTHFTGNCEIGVLGLNQVCECEEGFEFNYSLDDEGNNIPPACIPIN